jgi:glycosyltransferase involved in cell wall biosynthesis
MKILAFTAGAARMYCGSCLRDNALAAELKRQGHDVVLQPLYTPTRTDEDNVSSQRVFLNGISVCLEQHAAYFRRAHPLLDRLWHADWMIRLAARTSIAVSPRLLGEMTVSMLRGEEGRQRQEIRRLTEWLAHEPPPDLVTLPNSLLIALARPVREALGRPVCCTLQGEELFLSQLPEPYRAQALDLIRAHAADVDGFVAVSAFAADDWRNRLGIPAHKIQVVPLGINLEGYPASRPSRTGVFTVGYLARVAPEKGLHALAEAYVKLRRLTGAEPAALEVAGYLAPEHRRYLRGIARRLRQAGLAREFHYHGELDRAGKLAFLSRLDAFSVPGTFDEPKGMPVLEAMAAGVPVVQPRRGAFPEILAAAPGGVLVEPDDPAALAQALLHFWRNPQLAAELGRRGAEGVRAHYSVSHMAARAVEAFAGIAGVRTHA